MIKISDKFLKYFCYPFHVSFVASRRIKHEELRVNLLTLFWIIVLLLATFISDVVGVIGILWLLWAVHLYEQTEYMR